MRILLSTFTFPPERNGVATVVYEQARGFAANGHQVIVATSYNRDRNLTTMRDEGIEIKQFDISGWRTYRGELGVYERFLRDCQQDISVFHCWQTWTTDLALPIMNNIHGTRVLVSHGVSANMVASIRASLSWLAWRPYVWRMPYMLTLFDHLVFLSGHEDHNRFLDFALVGKLGLTNYSIIPNGSTRAIAAGDQHTSRARFGVKARRVILNVAEFNPLKNQKKAIHAFRSSGVKDAALVLIGNSKNRYYEELESMIDWGWNQPEVIMLAGLDGQAIAEAYSMADMFLYTSLSDVQPLVLLDAMKAGLPFVSSDVGCVKDFPGGLVANNTRDMVHEIRELMSSAQLRRKLGEKGKEACERIYNWETIVQSYEDLFCRLCGSTVR